MKKYFYLAFILITLMVLPSLAHDASAQPPPPDAEDIPIDGGLTFLIVAGAAYGARKVYKQHKEQNN